MLIAHFYTAQSILLRNNIFAVLLLGVYAFVAWKNIFVQVRM